MMDAGTAVPGMGHGGSPLRPLPPLPPGVWAELGLEPEPEQVPVPVPVPEPEPEPEPEQMAPEMLPQPLAGGEGSQEVPPELADGKVFDEGSASVRPLAQGGGEGQDEDEGEGEEELEEKLEERCGCRCCAKCLEQPPQVICAAGTLTIGEMVAVMKNGIEVEAEAEDLALTAEGLTVRLNFPKTEAWDGWVETWPVEKLAPPDVRIVGNNRKCRKLYRAKVLDKMARRKSSRKKAIEMVTTTLKDLFLRERVDLGHAFRFFDKDLNGEVSAEELKDGLGRLNVTLPDDRMAAVVRAIDRDGDGAIDLAEFFAQFGAGTGVDFTRAKWWDGENEGYCFRKGPRGMGYYLDVGLENRLLLEGPTKGIAEEVWYVGRDGVETSAQVKHARLASLLNAPKAGTGRGPTKALGDILHRDRQLAPLRELKARSSPPKPQKKRRVVLSPPPYEARVMTLNGLLVDMNADYVWQTREWILQHAQREKEKLSNETHLITPKKKHGGMYKNSKGERMLKWEWEHAKPEPRASFLDKELELEYDGPFRTNPRVVELRDGLTLIPQVQPGRRVKGFSTLGFTTGWRAYGGGGHKFTPMKLLKDNSSKTLMR